MVFKHLLAGRLGLLAAVLVLASACGEGEISDSPAGARRGPEASGEGGGDFDAPTNDAPTNDAPTNDAPTNDAPTTSSKWSETVVKPDATNTGPNCSAPGCPNATLSPQNSPPLVITQDGATYENFTMTNGAEPIVVRARNVTFRNFYIHHDNWTGLYVDNVPNANLVLEYGEIEGGSPCSQLIEGDGITVRYGKFHSCDDIWKINDSYGSNGPVTIENSYFYDVIGGHGDTFMIWPNMDNDTTARHNHFVGGNTSIVIDASISPGATLLFEENWLHGGGAAYTIYCDTREGGARIYRDNLFDRNYQYGPVADPGCTWIENAYMDDSSTVPYSP